MARRKESSKPTKRRYSASQIALYVISLIIVLSMAIGFVLSVLPTPSDQGTVVTPATVTLTATVEPSVTPSLETEELPTEGTAAPQTDQ